MGDGHVVIGTDVTSLRVGEVEWERVVPTDPFSPKIGLSRLKVNVTESTEWTSVSLLLSTKHLTTLPFHLFTESLTTEGED